MGGPARSSCDRGQGTPGFDGGVAELRELQDHRKNRDNNCREPPTPTRIATDNLECAHDRKADPRSDGDPR